MIQEEGVETSDSHDVLRWMPCALQHLSAEIVVRTQRFVELLSDVLADGLFVKIQLKLEVFLSGDIRDVEVVVEQSSQEVISTRTGADAELVEYRFVLVELTKLGLQGLEDVDDFKRLAVHGDIPDFNAQEVSREYVLAVLAVCHVRYRRYYFGEEVPIGVSVFVFESHGCMVTYAGLSQVSELDDAFAGRKDELVVEGRVELGGGDDFRKFLEIVWFEVDDVERFDFVLQVPEVDPEVVRGDEVLSVGADGYRVDVVVVQVRVGPLEAVLPSLGLADLDPRRLELRGVFCVFVRAFEVFLLRRVHFVELHGLVVRRQHEEVFSLRLEPLDVVDFVVDVYRPG